MRIKLHVLETITSNHCMADAFQTNMLSIKQFSWWFLRSDLGNTESGHLMGTFFEQCRKNFTIMLNLNRHFVFCLYCAQTSLKSRLLTFFCINIKAALVQSKIDLLKSVFLYVLSDSWHFIFSFLLSEDIWKV